MALAKQAKILSKQQQLAVVAFLGTTRATERNIAIFLLSTRAGLRAKEIAHITWQMLTDAQGTIGEAIRLENSASKGTSGGVVWLNKELKAALETLKNASDAPAPTDRVIKSKRGKPMSAQVIVNTMFAWYKRLGFNGCSSHSGRRTFITNAARKISSVGGSMRDVQALARHSSLYMTQRYIESDIDAQKKVVQLV